MKPCPGKWGKRVAVHGSTPRRGIFDEGVQRQPSLVKHLGKSETTLATNHIGQITLAKSYWSNPKSEILTLHPTQWNSRGFKIIVGGGVRIHLEKARMSGRHGVQYVA